MGKKTQNLKRSREDSPSSDSTDIDQATPHTDRNWPRFLLIEDTNPQDKRLGTLSPFVIHKGLKSTAGEPSSVKKLSSGALLLECTSKQQSSNYLKLKSFVNVSVKVAPHKTLNSCKGVIRSPDLKYATEAEIVESFVHVADARRITLKKGTTTIATNTFILTFSTPTLPTSLHIGYLNLRVEPYIPNPLRCFQCQKFGHHKANCKNSQVCAKCGNPDHNSEDCKADACCVNCKGSHPSFSKDCREWKFEKDIQRLKTLQRLSYPEARGIVRACSAASTTTASYAQAAKRVNSSSVGCQTTFDTVPISRQPVTKSSSCQTVSTLQKLEDSKSVSATLKSKSSTTTKIPVNTSRQTSDQTQKPKPISNKKQKHISQIRSVDSAEKTVKARSPSTTRRSRTTKSPPSSLKSRQSRIDRLPTESVGPSTNSFSVLATESDNEDMDISTATTRL